MTFKDSIIQVIGKANYDQLECHANHEVSLAMKMSIKDEYGQDNYFQQRFLLGELFDISELFEEKGLKISPTDIINVLFRCKMLFAVKDENEYRKRVGSVWSIYDEYEFAILRDKKASGIDILTEEYLNRIDTFITEKTLLVKIENYISMGDIGELHYFFNDLFATIGLPFTIFTDDDLLIGFTTTGTTAYARRYSYPYLRTFLNLLRISGFIHVGQIEFGSNGVEIGASTLPVFLGSGSRGGLCWNEDKKEPWERIPDGCLWRSFGYRGISKMRIDVRNFSKIKDFYISCKVIFNHLNNPRTKKNKLDIYPILEILSSSTQITDLGAKILSIYCCLEHLFVPKNINRDNKKYITGGINALKPCLLDWFEKLHRLRCDYAHKGFIKRDDMVLGFIQESISNSMLLLKLKITTFDLNI